eukprot:2652675-Rhodomonas_salina.3
MSLRRREGCKPARLWWTVSLRELGQCGRWREIRVQVESESHGWWDVMGGCERTHAVPGAARGVASQQLAALLGEVLRFPFSKRGTWKGSHRAKDPTFSPLPLGPDPRVNRQAQSPRLVNRSAG